MMKLVVDNGAKVASAAPRQALLAQIHIARKTLAMEDEDYRAVLQRKTGHRSARDCNDRQLRDAVAEFERLGFRPSGASKRRDLGTGLTVRKARAMWISLYQLGAIEDGSDAALETFGQRQLRVERLQWASDREGFRLIEALKAIATRHGWDQRVPARVPSRERIRTLKDSLVGAQLAKLAAASVTITGPLIGDRSDWSDKRLESAAAELAHYVRSIPRNA